MKHSECNPLPQLKSKRAETRMCSAVSALVSIQCIYLALGNRSKYLHGLSFGQEVTVFNYVFFHLQILFCVISSYCKVLQKKKCHLKIPKNIIVNVLATALQFQKSNFIQITGAIGLIFFFSSSIKKVR